MSNFLLQYIPENLLIEAKISVNGDIPETRDLPPRDIRIALPNRKRNMLCCLA